LEIIGGFFRLNFQISAIPVPAEVPEKDSPGMVWTSLERDLSVCKYHWPSRYDTRLNGKSSNLMAKLFWKKSEGLKNWHHHCPHHHLSISFLPVYMDKL
jgi:hypothetical protein